MLHCKCSPHTPLDTLQCTSDVLPPPPPRLSPSESLGDTEVRDSGVSDPSPVRVRDEGRGQEGEAKWHGTPLSRISRSTDSVRPDARHTHVPCALQLVASAIAAAAAAAAAVGCVPGAF